MQLFLSLLLAAGVLFCPGTARCATAADPALRMATLSAGYPWTEGLILSFRRTRSNAAPATGKTGRSGARPTLANREPRKKAYA